MTNALTMTSRAAIVAAALAVPALPALAQTPPPADDAAGGAATTAPDTAAPDTTATDGVTTDAPAMDTPAMDSPAMDTPAADAPGLGGTTPGATGLAGDGMDGQPTYDQLLTDLRSGRDFGQDLEGIDEDTTVTVVTLSELRSQADTGAAGMPGDQPGMGTDGAAATTMDAPAGDMAAGTTTGAGTDTMATDTTTDLTADTATGTDTATTDMTADTATDTTGGMTGDAAGGAAAGMSAGVGDADFDAALAQGEGDLSTLRTSLADHPAVTQALEDAGHDADDVIGVYRDGDGLTVIVDDRDEA